MFKKHKTPSLTQARKMSKDGHNRRTKTVIDSCIDTIDRYCMFCRKWRLLYMHLVPQ